MVVEALLTIILVGTLAFLHFFVSKYIQDGNPYVLSFILGNVLMIAMVLTMMKGGELEKNNHIFISGGYATATLIYFLNLPRYTRWQRFIARMGQFTMCIGMSFTITTWISPDIQGYPYFFDINSPFAVTTGWLVNLIIAVVLFVLIFSLLDIAQFNAERFKEFNLNKVRTGIAITVAGVTLSIFLLIAFRGQLSEIVIAISFGFLILNLLYLVELKYYVQKFSDTQVWKKMLTKGRLGWMFSLMKDDGPKLELWSPKFVEHYGIQKEDLLEYNVRMIALHGFGEGVAQKERRYTVGVLASYRLIVVSVSAIVVDKSLTDPRFPNKQTLAVMSVIFPDSLLSTVTGPERVVKILSDQLPSDIDAIDDALLENIALKLFIHLYS